MSYEKSISIPQILTMLKEQPAHIATLTANVTPTLLRTAPAPGEWSAVDVLAHLRSCEEVWGGCIKTILSHNRPTIKAINPTTWLKQTNYRDLEFQPSLQAFMTQRTELLALLEPLSPEGWRRLATVTIAGKPSERTVFFYAQWLARHERLHVKQIAAIIATLRT